MKLLTAVAVAFAGLALAAPRPAPDVPNTLATPPEIAIARDVYSAEVAARSSLDAAINALLAMIGMLFPFNILIQDLDDIGLTASKAMANALHIQTTQNGLTTAPLKCTDITVVFARGTTEAGNVGAVVGPSFFTALQSTLSSKSFAIQGVNYGASVEGYLEGGDPAGAAAMAASIKSALTACPSTRLVMGGYSQGGQIVHNAAKQLGTTMQQVNSVVIFGDPFNGTAVTGAQGKTKIYCNVGDNICENGDLILEAHLTYARSAPDAAAFVASLAGQ